MDAMNNDDPFQGSAAIIHECKKLAKEFVNVTFQHCPIESNGAADELARQPTAPLWGIGMMNLLFFS